MKLWLKLMNERVVKAASEFMRFVCYAVMLFLMLGLLLSFMGRQSFDLSTGTGVYENAIYAEENHAPSSRILTVHMPADSVYVHSGDGEIDPMIQVGLSLMFVFHAVPLIFAFWILSRVFANIARGKIFTEENAVFLLGYGLIRFSVALFVPFIKLMICRIVNHLSEDSLSVGTGSDMLNKLIPGIAFLVAAYIIHYGIRLQDEADRRS